MRSIFIHGASFAANDIFVSNDTSRLETITDTFDSNVANVSLN